MITFMPAFLVFTACFLFAIIWPKIAIYLPIVFSSAYLAKVQVMGLPSTLLEVIMIAILLGVWIEFLLCHRVRAILSASWRIPPQRSLLWGIALFLVATTISAFIAPHPHVAWGFWKALVMEPIIYAVTLFVIVEKEKRAQNIVKALFTGGVVSIGLSFVNGGFGVDFWRFRGIYDVPNSLALIVAPLCTMGLVGWLLRRLDKFDLPATAPGAEQPCSAPGAVWVVLSLLFGIVLVATQSMAGLTAVAITVLGVVFFLKKGWKTLIVLGIIIVLGLGLQTGTKKLSHLLSNQSSSLIAREQIWYTSSRMIKQHLILGTGLGTFEPNYQNELKNILNSQNLHPTPFTLHPPLEWVVRDPHNIILSFWLNTGLLGLIIMSFLVINKIKKFVSALSKLRSNVINHDNTHQVLLGAGFLSLIIFGLFDVPYWKNDLALLWWVYLL